MSVIKNIIIAAGVVLTLVAGSASLAYQQAEVPPIVIAREAEAVARGVRYLVKRPVPGVRPSVTPPGHGVAYVSERTLT